MTRTFRSLSTVQLLGIRLLIPVLLSILSFAPAAQAAPDFLVDADWLPPNGTIIPSSWYWMCAITPTVT